jgi:hypothetical protein
MIGLASIAYESIAYGRCACRAAQLSEGGHALWMLDRRLLPLMRWTVAVPVLGALVLAVA